ncbi:Endoribonuclease L-PSP [Trichoderma velutinum]
MATRKIINRTGYSSPYLSEAVVQQNTVYCSGKIGLDVVTGELVSDDAGKQTEAALKLMEMVLRAAGSDLTKLLKVNIYLTSREDFAAMNAVYIATIPDPKPARACITVTELGKNAKVEIECTAYTENASARL